PCVSPAGSSPAPRRVPVLRTAGLARGPSSDPQRDPITDLALGLAGLDLDPPLCGRPLRCRARGPARPGRLRIREPARSVRASEVLRDPGREFEREPRAQDRARVALSTGSDVDRAPLAPGLQEPQRAGPPEAHHEEI